MIMAKLVVTPRFLAYALMNSSTTSVTIRQEGLWTVFVFSGGDELHMTTRVDCLREWPNLFVTAQMINFIRATCERFRQENS